MKIQHQPKKGLNINGNKWESEDEDTKKSEAQCGFCRKKYPLDSILKHIGNNEACKIYCKGFKKWKKDHKNIRLQHYRKEFGIKEELEQQKKRYASNSKVRENKRKDYEDDKQHQLILEQNQKKSIEKGKQKERWDILNRGSNSAMTKNTKCSNGSTNFLNILLIHSKIFAMKHSGKSTT